MDSNDRVADQYAVEPYVGSARRKVTNDRGLLFAGLGKHLPKKLLIDGALIVSPNCWTLCGFGCSC
jgi:hypothetical protein